MHFHYLLVCLFGMLILTNCQQKKAPQKEAISHIFHPKLVAIWVNNLDSTIAWYTQNLGFEIEREIKAYPDYNLRASFLKKNGFHLELLEANPSFPREEILPSSETYLSGLFKLGFLVGNIEKVYDELKMHENVEFITGIGELPASELNLKWPKRFFLIQDPDGNLIQYFTYDDDLMQEMKPFLAMLTVNSIDPVQNWYQEKLDFTLHDIVGEKGNRRAILERNNFILELWEPAEVINRTGFSSDTTILGFAKLAFGINDFEETYKDLKSNETQFLLSPDSSSFDWATKAMIVGDVEGNWVQFFGLKE